MVQFDPNMVAQMLMQPIQRASENLGGGPFGIGADAGGSYFVDPEVAARTGYGTAVTGTSFFPGAGIVDAAGGAVDVTGQPLPSFSENIREGQFTDAGLQALGVAGDIATIAAPFTLGTSALVGAMMKAPRAATKYKFENPIKVYQGRSKKGIKDFINPTDFYGDKKVSFGTNELVTAEQFANKQTVSYPGRARDGSEGPTKTTLIPGDVAELEFDIQNPLEVNRKDIGFKRDNEKAAIAEARAKGHDGLKIVYDNSDKIDYVAFDNEQVRVVNPSLYPERDYDYSPTSAELADKATDVASDASKAERQARIAANRREANIARFGYDPNDPETLPDTSYRIQHQPRGPNEENPVRLDDLTKSTTGEEAGYPDNFYSSEGQRIYAQGPSFSGDEYGMANTESYNIIKSVKGNPDAEVTIYRGVPDEESITDINPGDFVTLSKKYAELHAASGYGRSGDEAGKIISKKVKVKDIYWDQNDVNEFGYFPDSD